ncbi:uncharacterized protein LOC124796452 [Schistocerca piceifrons]|uniref:uncharacterized protein LOC124796452 n=1 Tax=Schistocerca piceifrons TaxID=274613 RepID=UPI001F5F465E|nr:uncharacterized protein LOC124796452 [Schistocerca piceifrons]
MTVKINSFKGPYGLRSSLLVPPGYPRRSGWTIRHRPCHLRSLTPWTWIRHRRHYPNKHPQAWTYALEQFSRGCFCCLASQMAGYGRESPVLHSHCSWPITKSSVLSVSLLSCGISGGRNVLTYTGISTPYSIEVTRVSIKANDKTRWKHAANSISAASVLDRGCGLEGQFSQLVRVCMPCEIQRITETEPQTLPLAQRRQHLPIL